MSLSNKTVILRVWRVKSGEVIHEEAFEASAIAFSPDKENSFLGYGNQAGEIKILSLATKEPVAALPSQGREVKCLAFNQDRRRPLKRRKAGWLLAAGDTGGLITVWDLEAKAHRVLMRGSFHHIHAVAFSPDGVTLASVGRTSVKLWDLATGRPLLDLRETNWMTDVAFAPSGKRLAVISRKEFGYPVFFSLWDLELGQGLQVLRGLLTPVENVVLSPNERLLAAIGNDCRIAVWDLERESLLHLFEAPATTWVDNTGLIFSPDNKGLVFSGSNATKGQVIAWDLATGERTDAWSVRPGLNNLLAFHPVEKLVLIQREAQGGELPRKGSKPILTIEALQEGGRIKPLARNPNYMFIDWPRIPHDGRFLAFLGYKDDRGKTKRQVTILDTQTGKEIWSQPPEEFRRSAQGTRSMLITYVDPEGKNLVIHYQPNVRPLSKVLEIPSGKDLGPTDFGCLSRNWKPSLAYRIVDPDRDEGDFYLVPRGQKEPVLTLSQDVARSGTQETFDTAGNRFAWGCRDGTVRVIHIPEVRRRLKELGLEW